MKYFRSYIKTLYYCLGITGAFYLVSTFFTNLELLPVIMVYVSILVAFAGPIKIFIENNT
jgi:ABC-type transport system involved in multi-copper enzyme maturation permease subunit